ncbi:MAG: carbonic anhydrase [Polaromonas sp.]|nr:carbonic anhydrase [Gemmatimonadaceae bacterium]
MYTHQEGSSRRDLLKRMAWTGAGLLATTALPATLRADETRADDPLLAPAPTTPREALDALYRGNARFVEGKITAPNRNMERLKEVAAGQKPFAAFLGCADSRVPVEIVFDQGFGDVFVTRIAGNVADAAIIGSLEFGVEVLGAQVLYVLGHSKCGAVSATLKGDAVPGQISTLYQHIRRAAKESGGDLDVAIRRNVQIQAEILSEASPVIARRIADGKLLIAGGIYDLYTGRVQPVDLSKS